MTRFLELVRDMYQIGSRIISRIIIDNKRESQGYRNSRNELKQHLKQGVFRTKCNKLNDSPNPSTMCHLLPIVVILFVKMK